MCWRKQFWCSTEGCCTQTRCVVWGKGRRGQWSELPFQARRQHTQSSAHMILCKDSADLGLTSLAPHLPGLCFMSSEAGLRVSVSPSPPHLSLFSALPS